MYQFLTLPPSLPPSLPQVDPQARFSVAQVLKHPWVTGQPFVGPTIQTSSSTQQQQQQQQQQQRMDGMMGCLAVGGGREGMPPLALPPSPPPPPPSPRDLCASMSTTMALEEGAGGGNNDGDIFRLTSSGDQVHVQLALLLPFPSFLPSSLLPSLPSLFILYRNMAGDVPGVCHSPSSLPPSLPPFYRFGPIFAWSPA